MAECPHCNFNDDVQSVVDGHVDNIHEDGSGVLIQSTVVDKSANSWSCTAVLLTITTNYRGLIINDVEVIVADPDEDKMIQVSVVSAEPTMSAPNPSVSLYILERFSDSDYPEIPEGNVVVQVLKEFSLAAGGTALVEV